MLLTTLEGLPARLGTAVNVATMVVFVSETLVLLALTADRRRWLRRHRLPVAVTLASIPAVLFALGPVQVLRLVRLVRFVGAVRILRVRRIVKAGRLLRDRAGLTGWAWRTTTLLLSLAAALLVAVVLADPSSTTRQAIDAAVGRLGFLVVLLAGALLGGATYVVARARRADETRSDGPRAEVDPADG